MCNQPRTIDMPARDGRFVEDVGNDVLDDVLAKLQAIVEN
jgi:hypothetical protein